MKKSTLIYIASLFAGIGLVSCTNDVIDDPYEPDSDLLNEYAKSWFTTFGNIDTAQDWCTVQAVNADVSMEGDIASVEIYNANPADGGHLIGATSSGYSMRLDTSEGASSVYARRINTSGSIVDEGYYPIVNKHVSIDGSAMPRALSRAGDEITYAHTPSYFDAMIICEDLGSFGDFDFNDIVFGLKHVSGDSPSLTIVPMAAGGVYAANIYFKSNLIGEIHDLIHPGSPTTTMLNTSVDDIGSVSNLNHIDIVLDSNTPWTIADNWCDLSIKVTGKDNTVNITAPTTGHAPQMICIGGDWFWPKEREDIKTVYTDFAEWSCDANATTWLGNWNDGKVVKWSIPSPEPVDTRMWFTVTTTNGSPYTLRLNGSDTSEQAQSGEKYYIDEPLTSCKNMFTVYSESQAFLLNREGNYIFGHPIAENNILEVTFSDNFDMSKVTTFENMFAGCASLTSVNTDAWIKPSHALVSAESMFKGCRSLTSLDLTGWDVSANLVFYDFCSGCSALRSLNLSGWSFASGVDIRYFLENTTDVNVKCSAAAQTVLSSETNLGGTSVTFSR